jgi:hypothetical protein
VVVLNIDFCALARYAKHNGNFVLVVSGSLEAQRTKKFIEIVYDLLIKGDRAGFVCAAEVWSPLGRAEVSPQ